MSDSGELSGEQLAAIARGLGSIKARSLGKGPTGAKAYQNDQFVFCVMEGTITPVERTLLDAGDAEMVRELRLRYQERMAEQYVGAVENATGREVLSYQSQILFDPDYMIEMFVLEDGGRKLPEAGEQ